MVPRRAQDLNYGSYERDMFASAQIKFGEADILAHRSIISFGRLLNTRKSP